MLNNPIIQKTQKYLTPISIIGIFFLVALTVFLNKKAEFAVDRTKIPEKVELSRGFQRWITNIKNKQLDVSADDFRLKEENEIYTSKAVMVYSVDDPVKMAEFNTSIEAHRNLEGVVFSPSDRQFVDYRHELRDRFTPFQVHHYGIRDNKIIDSRIVDCSEKVNCYFDRAYFLNNDVFVVSELSRNVDKHDPNLVPCGLDVECIYTFKVHVIDLVNNSRLVYESKPFSVIYNKLLPGLN